MDLTHAETAMMVGPKMETTNMKISQWFCGVLTVAGLFCMNGCATMDNMTASVKRVPAKMRSLAGFSRADDAEDPLLTDSTSVSDEYRSAKRELKKADETMLKFAQWREDLGDLPEAKQRYHDILADNPHHLDARLGLARVEYKSGRIAEAQSILEATARKHPDSSAVWVEMGRIQSEREQYGQAVQSLQKAVALDSKDVTAKYELGLALIHSDRLDEAKVQLTDAVGESAALYNIGYVLHQEDRNQEAALWFKKSLESHPDERTRAMSYQMLTQLGFGNQQPRTQLAAVSRQENTVDVKQTSFESYRETPGQTVENASPFMNTGHPAAGPTTTTTQAPVASPAQAGSSTGFASLTNRTPHPSSGSYQPHGAYQPPSGYQPSGATAAPWTNGGTGHATYNNAQSIPQWTGPAPNPGGITIQGGTPSSNGGVVEPPMWQAR